MLPFFKYCAGDQNLFSWFNGFGLASLLVGVACFEACRRVSASAICSSVSMVLTAVLASRSVRLPASATAAIFASEILRQFSFGISCPVLWAMMADVADYGEWKTGRRATATVTAAVVFALWAGLALGGWITGWLFDATATCRTPRRRRTSLMGIRLVASVYSGLAFFVTAVCLLFYPITRSKNQEIADELAERRKRFAASNRGASNHDP